MHINIHLQIEGERVMNTYGVFHKWEIPRFRKPPDAATFRSRLRLLHPVSAGLPRVDVSFWDAVSTLGGAVSKVESVAKDASEIIRTWKTYQ